MKLKKYLPMLEGKTRYPVVLDSTGTVLSWPPMINSEHSKLRLTTKHVLIECNAVDLTKARVVLNVLVTAFSQYCARPFTVEPVKIVYPDGREELTPDLDERDMDLDVDYVTGRLGVELSSDQIVSVLERMGLAVVPDMSSASSLRVRVPATRSDILHCCDLMEDVAIGYGYNQIPPSLPLTNTVAQAFPLNTLSDLLRLEMAQAGYSEVLTLSLVSENTVGGHVHPHVGSVAAS
jgi:phenylalanyl-tRNA synthetase beta chain